MDYMRVLQSLNESVLSAEAMVRYCKTASEEVRNAVRRANDAHRMSLDARLFSAENTIDLVTRDLTEPTKTLMLTWGDKALNTADVMNQSRDVSIDYANSWATHAMEYLQHVQGLMDAAVSLTHWWHTDCRDRLIELTSDERESIYSKLELLIVAHAEVAMHARHAQKELPELPPRGTSPARNVITPEEQKVIDNVILRATEIAQEATARRK